MVSDKVALISVYDKGGIVDFAKALVDLGYDILASGGTAKALTDANIAVIDVATIVGPPILGHRVVTLSREVHAGLLATGAPDDLAEMERLALRRIDLVCVDMYPLRAEIAKPAATRADVIEKTDIGGPTMLRSAAKGRRVVICDPADRMPTISWIRSGMPKPDDYVAKLCAKAEAIVADYVLASARYQGNGAHDGMVGTRVSTFKYGENPHQKKAAHYAAYGNEDPLALHRFALVGGSDPSFINGADLDALVATVSRIAAGLERNGFSKQRIAVAMKHGNVCGVGVDELPHGAVEKMVLSDPQSLFGGAVLCTFAMDFSVATSLRTLHGERPLDVVAAPLFLAEGVAALNRKNERCRMYENHALAKLGEASLDLTRRVRPCRGGFFTQDADAFVLELPAGWKETLTLQAQIDMIVGWGVGSTATSNSIVLVEDGMLLGRGLAQPSRVFAAEVALLQAQKNGHTDRIKDAVAYSDSFFPFEDGPTLLGSHGIKAAFATSGSVRDGMVVEAARAHGLTLYTLPDAEARGFSRH